MLLLINIGNTNTSTGFYYSGKVQHIHGIGTRTGWSPVEYTDSLAAIITDREMPGPAGAAICSVVPEATHGVIQALRERFEIDPVNVDRNTRTDMTFHIDNIEQLGADRIANAVAAAGLYKENIIVADFGTATTLCAISEQAEYLGGTIMPGLALSAACLSEKTSKLPSVGLKKPEQVLGKNTEDNILSGVIIGHAGAVEKIISEIKRESERDYKVVATGGAADLVVPFMNEVHYRNPELTLEGLKLIYDLNS